ncbi:MAG: type II toxin-antitoxin system RelE/ParE family toxin [Gammaproteobacteria bacterium]
MKISFLKPAEEELRQAIDYYEAHQTGLGFALFEEVWAAIERIEQHPEAWQSISQRARRCRLKRFPYGVIYQIRVEEILVVAIAHLHRKPGYWRSRIS